MTRDWRLPICAIVSIAGHIAFARGLSRLPRHEDHLPKRKVSIRVIAPRRPRSRRPSRSAPRSRRPR